MNKQLELVKEFHEAFGQPVLNKEGEISIDRRELRLSLLFEELTELADAYGLQETFNRLLASHLEYGQGEIEVGKDTLILNKKEVLDATCDLQYILSGTILENGQQEVFDNAFQDIHDSNMSELCNNQHEALDTMNKYNSEGIQTYCKPCGLDYIGVFRFSDNKVLKSINYKPVDLNKYVL
jgi:predicted HAD superfamily Cof-like phosphohydrolase